LTLKLGRGDDPDGVPDSSGALNLSPGTTVPLRFEIAVEGRPGRISVGAEGLPSGVAAEPVEVRVPRGVATIEATLNLRVDPDAGRAIGALRVVATAEDADLRRLTRRASATLVLAASPPDDPRPPTTRVVTEFPIGIAVPADH
jgi:hypothetical protein